MKHADTATYDLWHGQWKLARDGHLPAYPFGFGLSYTTFQFSKEIVSPTDDGGLDVSVRVKNSGSVAGDEVVQVYLGAPSRSPANVQFAVRSLSQFQRVTLAPGETEAVKVHVPPRQLDYWSEAAQRWVRATGDRTVWVGDADSLDHLPQSVTVMIPAQSCQGSARMKSPESATRASSLPGSEEMQSGALSITAGIPPPLR